MFFFGFFGSVVKIKKTKHTQLSSFFGFDSSDFFSSFLSGILGREISAKFLNYPSHLEHPARGHQVEN